MALQLLAEMQELGIQRDVITCEAAMSLGIQPDVITFKDAVKLGIQPHVITCEAANSACEKVQAS